MHHTRMYLLLLKGIGFNLQIIWMMLIMLMANRRDELPGVGGGGGGLIGLIFDGYVPLASQNRYPFIVYFLANYRPHLSQFWANVIFSIHSHFPFMQLPYKAF